MKLSKRYKKLSKLQACHDADMERCIEAAMLKALSFGWMIGRLRKLDAFESFPWVESWDCSASKRLAAVSISRVEPFHHAAFKWQSGPVLTFGDWGAVFKWIDKKCRVGPSKEIVEEMREYLEHNNAKYTHLFGG